ncbi:ATP-grasp domain-containing protein [Campylobacter hyointestinalis subsp. hyointestinalis LMG 9260]|uniref:ATP-grasp domain-containing protein n=1 Tax=Campylobacter hyointestinalis TaxID=198 RepID=UPI000728D62A|nr:ATP-grasp domain-containing protein [Campylobacter hyointestinalis]ANE33197.1 ATP-grasp domain-containing protein [Campylobacter hyointestinalis subsp. hyointestinalis LMG 9260]TWO29456.1 ATP-grasp domain-containing protein [Campylobacter hyointestinalis]CUU73449.1 carbamoyl phosphate synthase large subunit [Campylobacter hyointestinalis subsp. hyointestinalis]CUU78038.1 carbamoyl phosphate synthase large subunit [Campylobacter hyointestinalis subsp. hyointestinalis]SUW89392.1 carbamoyl pho
MNINKLKFPLVVKPSDRSAGRGVVKVNNISELKIAYKEAKSFATNGIVLIEEVLKGRQFSVETISENGIHTIVAITEEFFRQGKYEDDFLEVGHLIPARLNDKEKSKIQKETLKILDAFEIKFGACHIELKLDINGVKIIEIASRMGGWRNTLIRDAYGYNINEMLLNVSLNKKMKFKEQKNKFNAIVNFIFTKDDFEHYKWTRKKYPEFISDDFVNAKDDTKFFYASDLLCSNGFYYLKIPPKTDMKQFLPKGYK